MAAVELIVEILVEVRAVTDAVLPIYGENGVARPMRVFGNEAVVRSGISFGAFASLSRKIEDRSAGLPGRSPHSGHHNPLFSTSNASVS
ncbi:hypothetical protein [Rhizorhabdus dicambivorans]|uniref:hypothetical protein n=1 Tax=Rhizorhabdus dicambivorans TaxID=1850238 RepID=UPI001596541B|nr:hypothetical protein [Rhizorhabdus dicambivorans]